MNTRLEHVSSAPTFPRVAARVAARVVARLAAGVAGKIEIVVADTRNGTVIGRVPCFFFSSPIDS